MKTCAVCGNDIQDRERVCPFCRSPQRSRAATGSTTSRQERIRTVNLKKGLPRVDDALRTLHHELTNARAGRVKVVRLIHGYGSTGTGGKIKHAVQQELASLARSGQIKMSVVGDDYAASDPGKELRSRYPELARSSRTDFGNPGITFVEL